MSDVHREELYATAEALVMRDQPGKAATFAYTAKIDSDGTAAIVRWMHDGEWQTVRVAPADVDAWRGGEL